MTPSNRPWYYPWDSVGQHLRIAIPRALLAPSGSIATVLVAIHLHSVVFWVITVTIAAVSLWCSACILANADSFLRPWRRG